MPKQTLVFLYGLLGEATQFQAQVDAFSQQYDVYVPDWYALCDPGMAADADLLDGVLRRLAQHLQQRGVHKPVLVGHSLGGVLALLLVTRLNFAVSHLVILDTSLTPLDEKKKRYRALSAELIEHADNGEYIDDFFRRTFFSQADDPAVVNRLIEHCLLRSESLWFQLLSQAVEVNFASCLAQLSMPTLYVARPQTDTNLSKLRGMNACIEVVSVSDSGHFVMVFAKDQLNAALRDFLAS